MYTITRHETSVPVPEYLENYVDIPTFRTACQACPNYGKVWSCPPYDFDVEAFWKQFSTLQLLASKITFSEELLERTYTPEEQKVLLSTVLQPEKIQLSREMLEREQEYPGSVSLSAGSCSTCENGCSKPLGLPCRNPDTMRHSIESLGGNVGLTVDKLMGIKLEWMEKGRLPHHFVLVCGLLVP